MNSQPNLVFCYWIIKYVFEQTPLPFFILSSFILFLLVGSGQWIMAWSARNCWIDFRCKRLRAIQFKKNFVYNFQLVKTHKTDTMKNPDRVLLEFVSCTFAFALACIEHEHEHGPYIFSSKFVELHVVFALWLYLIFKYHRCDLSACFIVYELCGCWRRRRGCLCRCRSRRPL